MRAAAALVIGLIAQLLAPPHVARAGAEGTALPVEIGADSARLALVWPAPAGATLAVVHSTARLRATIAMAPLPAPAVVFGYGVIDAGEISVRLAALRTALARGKACGPSALA